MYELESCEVCRYYKPRDGDPPPSRDNPPARMVYQICK